MQHITNKNLIYVTVAVVAKAKAVSVQAVQKACLKNQYVVRFSQPKRGGNRGKSYEILVSSLEPDVQIKIFKAHPELLDRKHNTCLNSYSYGCGFAADNQGSITTATECEAAFSSNKENASKDLSNQIGLFSGASIDLGSCVQNPAPVFLQDFYNTSINSQGGEYSPLNKQIPALFSLESKSSELANDSDGAQLLLNSAKDTISSAPFSLAAPVVPETPIPEKAKRAALAKADLINHWQTYRKKQKSKAQADKDFVQMYNSKILSPAIYSILGKVSTGTLHRWKKLLSERDGDTNALAPAYNYGSKDNYAGTLSQVEQKAFLTLMLRPAKLSVGNAYRIIRFCKDKLGIEKLHCLKTYERYCKQFIRNNYDMWVLMREGEKALTEKVLKYNERDISLINAGDVFIADGHTLDFQVINPFTGKPCRATMVCYQDWKSSDIAGYEIMINENTQCIASALRNSILRFGKTPAIAYQDNGKAFRGKYFHGSEDFNDCGLRGVFSNLGILTMFARPYNAKAKPVERFFREFTQICESSIPSYVGNTIENKPAHMKRNENFHKTMHAIVNHNYVPTIEEAKQLIDNYLKFYRAQPCPHVKGKTIGEVFNEAKGTGINPEKLDTMMMAEEIRKIGRNGIKFLGTQYYNEALYGIKDKVVIKYSLADLSTIKVYSLSGEFMCEAKTDMLLHPAAAYLGTETDLENVKHAIKEVAKLKKSTIQKAKRHIAGHLTVADWEQIPQIEDKKIRRIKGKSVTLKPETQKNKYIMDLSDVEVILPDKPEQKYSMF